jgi:hypothetical protein
VPVCEFVSVQTHVGDPSPHVRAAVPVREGDRAPHSPSPCPGGLVTSHIHTPWIHGLGSLYSMITSRKVTWASARSPSACLPAPQGSPQQHLPWAALHPDAQGLGR